jgi:hypothetical protein
MGSFLYEAHSGFGARIRYSGMTNHELRELMTGLWLGLDEDDKIDHIRALEHYLLPDSTPSRAATAIANAIARARGTER